MCSWSSPMGEGTSFRSKAVPLQQEAVHFELYIVLLVPIEWNCSRISNCLFVWVDDCRRVANGCLLFLSIVKMRPLWFWVLCVWIGWCLVRFGQKRKLVSFDRCCCQKVTMRISSLKNTGAYPISIGDGRIHSGEVWDFSFCGTKITQRQSLPPAVQKQSRWVERGRRPLWRQRFVTENETIQMHD